MTQSDTHHRLSISSFDHRLQNKVFIQTIFSRHVHYFQVQFIPIVLFLTILVNSKDTCWLGLLRPIDNYITDAKRFRRRCESPGTRFLPDLFMIDRVFVFSNPFFFLLRSAIPAKQWSLNVFHLALENPLKSSWTPCIQTKTFIYSHCVTIIY